MINTYDDTFQLPALEEAKVNAPAHFPIFGEETYCKRDSGFTTAVVKGLYNTGTNVLLNLLISNCWGNKAGKSAWGHLYDRDTWRRKIEPRVRNVTFERFTFSSVWNTSKHEPSPSVEWLEQNAIDPDGSLNRELNIVIIKDPLSFIKSLCKENYYLYPLRQEWFDNELCPYNLSGLNGTASANNWHLHLYHSVVETWNVYYSSWMRSTFTPPMNTMIDTGVKQNIKEYAESLESSDQPRFSKTLWQSVLGTFLYLLDYSNQLNAQEQALKSGVRQMQRNLQPPTIVVRFEDVLFHPEQVVDRVCSCVNAHRSESTLVKSAQSKPHGQSRNRSEAMAAYSETSLYRAENFMSQDLTFLRNHLNHTIMDIFGYTVPNMTEEVLVPQSHALRKRFWGQW